MDILGKDAVPFTNFCEWCCAVGTNRCGRCHIAYYCCREHQINHWSIHKKVCQKSLPPAMPVKIANIDSVNTSDVTFSSFGDWCQSNVPRNKNEDINQMTVPGSRQIAIPTSSQMTISTSNQMAIPTSSQMTISTSNQMTIPTSSQMAISTSNQMAMPTSNQMAMPTSSQMAVPTSNQMAIPTSSQMVVPTSSQMAVPTSSQMAVPTSSQMVIPTNVYDPNNCNLSPEKSMDFHIPSEDEIFSSITSELLSSDNNFWGLINSCDTQSISDFGVYLEKEAINQITETYNDPTLNTYVSTGDESSQTTDDVHIMQSVSLNDICLNIVHDLNTYGICVLDKFIGKNCGNLILQEVKNLYLKGIFKKGELVNPSPYASKESIRNDVITWIDGSEPDCKHIGNLMRKLDVVVTTSNKMPKNGLLSKYKLHRRTKAMIACYPGDGTYYKKHVDNPHRDGRCITCIYYLNQNWDIKTHGGLLRMFPSAYDSQVANIEPIFDRMIFFWSDKRNPHEVLPSYATRFAITVWYFDADERDQALKMSRDRALMKSPNQPFIH